MTKEEGASYVESVLKILNQDAISQWTMSIQPGEYEGYSVLTATIVFSDGIYAKTQKKLDELLNT